MSGFLSDSCPYRVRVEFVSGSCFVRIWVVFGSIWFVSVSRLVSVWVRVKFGFSKWAVRSCFFFVM